MHLNEISKSIVDAAIEVHRNLGGPATKNIHRGENMATTANIERLVMELPPAVRREVFDFVGFLSVKYRKKAEAALED